VIFFLKIRTKILYSYVSEIKLLFAYRMYSWVWSFCLLLFAGMIGRCQYEYGNFCDRQLLHSFFSGSFSCWKHRNSSLFQSCYSTLFMQLCRFKLTKMKLSCFGPPSFLSEWYDWTLHKIHYYPCLKLLIQFVGGCGSLLLGRTKLASQR